MHFQIIRATGQDGYPRFHWWLTKAEGNVCRSIGGFDTEADARSDIAAVKKSMKGAYRCKVESAGRNNPEGGEN